MIDRAYLEARRGEHTHYVVPATGEKRCCLCLGVWPCEQSEILDLALSAEGYRKALAVAQDYADAQRAWQSNQIQLWEYVTQRRDALLAAFPGVQGEQQ